MSQVHQFHDVEGEHWQRHSKQDTRIIKIDRRLTIIPRSVAIIAEGARVLANIETDAAGRLFIHFRDLDLTHAEVRGVALHFGDGDWKCTAAHSPSWPGGAPLVVQGGEIRLPGFAHYALLVLESTRSGT